MTGRLIGTVISIQRDHENSVLLTKSRLVQAVERYRQRIQNTVSYLVGRERRLRHLVREKLYTVQGLVHRIKHSVVRSHAQSVERFSILQDMINALNPNRLLERGYSIVRHRGSVVKSRAAIRLSDNLSITVADGDIHATVTEFYD